MLATAMNDGVQFRMQPVHIPPNDDVSAHFDRNVPFCVLAQSKARYSQIGGFFLNSPRIGDDDSCAPL